MRQAVWVLVAMGCAAPVVGEGSRDPGANSTPTDPLGPSDGLADPPGTGGVCATTGPLLDIPTEAGRVTRDTCTGAIVEQVFGQAVCACENVALAGYLTTRSFDSSVDPNAMMESGGAVGINGTYTSSGYADVGGSFVIAAPHALTFAGYINAGGDLKLGGDVTAAGYIAVARDAWFSGNVLVPGYVEVQRDVHQPTGSTMLTVLNVGGATHNAPFAVEPPCPCRPDQIVDVAAMVQSARVDNDNATIGLSPNAMSNVVGIGERFELPCGSYYLDSIGGIGDITLAIGGHAALYVGGNVEAIGNFEVELAPGAELDLFIGGNLVNVGRGAFGDPSRPAGTRVYVAGGGDVLLVGASEFVGNLYAPHSRIAAAGAAFVSGSLFGRQIDMPGALFVHYDLAVTEVGEDCPVQPPAGSCSVCDGTCGGQACIAGSCAACRSDADCCGTNVCHPDGSCGPLLI